MLNPKIFTRVEDLYKRRDRLRLTESSGASWSCTIPGLRARRRQARPQGEERASPRSTSAFACLPRNSPERPGDEQALRLVLDGEARSRGLPYGARGRGPRRRRAGHQGQARHHAVALERRAVPAVLVAARSAREGLERLIKPRRQRRHDRQPPIIAEIVALRAERAKLLGSRRYAALAPRRHHGQDARRRARAADGGVAAGAVARGRGARSRCRRLRAAKAATSSIAAVGLALLRGEGAQGQLRPRRGRDQALLRSSTT